jgi:hypothetical protein
MAVYSELELRYARPVADAIIHSSGFREWLLAGTRFENDYLTAMPIEEIQHNLRDPQSKMKNPYWFNYYCGKDSRCGCKIGTGIETDILIILERADRRRLGLHIEVKRPGEQLRNGQAESYPRRAACWANPNSRPRKVPPHQDFLTVLVCGRELKSDRRRNFFDKVVFHNEIKKQVEGYPEG